MAIDRSNQPIVKDAAGVLVGVAQIRVGKPSIRATGTAAVGTVTAVGQSDKILSTTDNTSYVIRPKTVYVANTGTASITVGGTYTAKYDGCIIIRAVDASNVNVFAPNNYMKTAALSGGAITSYSVETANGVASGITLDATFTNISAGDTWVIPIWSGVAQDKNQTGIVSPYSMFNGSVYSVGGLRAATFNAAINGVKTLQTGFPSITADQIIDSTSVKVSFEGLEFTNSNMLTLRQMMNEIVNKGNIAAVSIEAVMRTRGGTLVSFWVPSATFTTFPELSPGNDYSSVNFELEALKQTEITGESAYYNAALAESYIYSELYYTH